INLFDFLSVREIFLRYLIRARNYCKRYKLFEYCRIIKIFRKFN
ncbi:hypothetical protein A5875_000071, partial [Enterococcus sp. 3H8_DIV0648]